MTCSRHPGWPLYLLLLASLALPRAAFAQAPPPPTQAFAQPLAQPAQTPGSDSGAAKEHYERATAAYALGNYAEAALSYERAFELKPDSALLYNAAQAHRRAGNRTRAIELYRSFLQVFPRAENRDVAERHLRELERATELETQAAAPPPLLPAAGPAGARAPAPPPGERPADLRPSPLWKRRWLWLGVGAGAVLAGTVAAFALSGKDDPQPTWGRVGP